MLILASASPRRHELLISAGIPHVVRPVSVPEIRLASEAPDCFVLRLAQEKAYEAFRCDCAQYPGASEQNIVLGADTTVVIDAEILEKPLDDEDARRMLRLLSGRKHSVYTGICILSGRRSISEVAKTTVEFDILSEQEIAAYVESREPFDKAGGYGIQGLASKFVKSINGCYSNVVGLPVSLVYRHLKTL